MTVLNQHTKIQAFTKKKCMYKRREKEELHEKTHAQRKS